MLKDIIELSRYYGSDSRYTIAGGGNSSWKDGETMMVKASGFPMGSIAEDGFVAMSIPRLQEIWDKSYPSNRSDREAQFLTDISNARMEGETLRPSVETLLHQLFPYMYVMHTHPTLINGLSCAVAGERLTQELFGEKVFWVPSMDPGYYLAISLYKLFQHKSVIPQVLILQNHGLFVAANSKEEVYAIHNELMMKLETFFKGRGVEVIEEHKMSISGEGGLREIAPLNFTGTKLLGSVILDLVKDYSSFTCLETPLTPDQIVYAGPQLLWLESWNQAKDRVSRYKEVWGKFPQVLGVKEEALYIIGEGDKQVDTATAITKEAIRTLKCCELAGGVNPLMSNQIEFIHNWEAEHYRSKVHKGG